MAAALSALATAIAICLFLNSSFIGELPLWFLDVEIGEEP